MFSEKETGMANREQIWLHQIGTILRETQASIIAKWWSPGEIYISHFPPISLVQKTKSLKCHLALHKCHSHTLTSISGLLLLLGHIMADVFLKMLRRYTFETLLWYNKIFQRRFKAPQWIQSPSAARSSWLQVQVKTLSIYWVQTLTPLKLRPSHEPGGTIRKRSICIQKRKLWWKNQRLV